MRRNHSLIRKTKDRFVRLSLWQKAAVFALSLLLVSGAIYALAELGIYGENGPEAAPNSLDYGLAGYWNFEEGEGQTIYDRSGNGNDGMLGYSSSADEYDPTFGPGHDSSGPGGTGIVFDGVDDNIGIAVNRGFDAPAGMSVGGWIKPSIASSSFRTGGWNYYSQGYGTYPRYEFGHWGNDNPRIKVYNNTGASFSATATQSLSADTWYHIFAVVDAGTGELEIYVNGTLNNSVGFSGSLPAITSLIIGGGSSGCDFPGAIDEFRVYDRALSEDEIRMLYNQKKPILEMKFDEGSGTVAHDESFNNNDGTINGATWTEGKSGSALSFDGTDDYVEVAKDLTNGLRGITVSAWVNSASAANIFRSGEANALILHFRGAGFYLTGSDGTVSNYLAWDVPPPVNEWVYLSASWDGDTMRLYQNGVPQSTTLSFAGGIAHMLRISTEFSIGKHFNIYQPTLDGAIDNVRIYNYARTADEILTDYNSGLAAHLGQNNQDLDAGLVGHWDMEEGSGQTVYDKSGNGNDCGFGLSSSVDEKDPVFASGHDSSGPGGTGVVFDGINDYLDCGNDSSLDLTGAMSFGGWVRISDLSELHTLFGKGQGMGSLGIKGYVISYHTSGALYFDTYASDGSVRDALASTTTITDTGWHHVMGVWDGTTGTNGKKIYIDGVLAGQRTSSVSVVGSGSYTFEISSDTAGPWSYLAGSVDEVRVYNRALSEDEVRMLYNKKKPILHLRMDEGSGDTAHDESFHGNDFAVGSAAWTKGRSGTALSFDGDDYANAAGSIGMDEITISFFMQDTGTTVPWAGYVQLYQDYDDYISVLIDGFSMSRVVPVVRIGGVNYDAPDVAMPSGLNHYAAVYSKSGNFRKTYVNGILMGTVSGWSGGFTSTSFILGENTKSILDDLRIYNYARTADEIITDYNDGLAAHLGKNEQDPNYGLAGYWDFEEGTGLTAYDKSGNGNDGVLGTSSAIELAKPFFAAGHDSRGENGTGLGLTGRSEYVNAGNGSSLQLTNAGTIALWVKPNTLDQDDFSNFVTRRSNLSGGSYLNYSYSFHWRGSGDVIRLAISDGSSEQDTALNYVTAPLPTDLDWHHMVGSWDGSNLKIYIDGVLAASVAQNLNAQAGSDFVTAIGGYAFSTSAVGRQEFDGTLDEIRVYNRALSEDEIRMLFNEKRPTLEFRFDEGSGTTAYDESFNDNDGVLGGGTAGYRPSWTQGRSGTALLFDGVDDYVNAGRDGSLDIGGDFTYTAWVRFDDLDYANNTGRIHMLSAKGNPDQSSSNAGWWISYDNRSNGSSFQYTCFGNSAGGYAGGGNNFNGYEYVFASGTFYHVGVVISGSSQARLYIDGRQLGEAKALSNLALSAPSYDLAIGSNGTQVLDGALDDIRIYNYARTSDEILADYNAGLAARLR